MLIGVSRCILQILCIHHSIDVKIEEPEKISRITSLYFLHHRSSTSNADIADAGQENTLKILETKLVVEVTLLFMDITLLVGVGKV